MGLCQATVHRSSAIPVYVRTAHWMRSLGKRFRNIWGTFEALTSSKVVVPQIRLSGSRRDLPGESYDAQLAGHEAVTWSVARG
jgi:hypothetical protein